MPINPLPLSCLCGGTLVGTKNSCFCGFVLFRCNNCKAIWAPDHKLDADLRYSYHLDLKLTAMVAEAEKNVSSLEVAKRTEDYNPSENITTKEQLAKAIADYKKKRMAK